MMRGLTRPPHLLLATLTFPSIASTLLRSSTTFTSPRMASSSDNHAPDSASVSPSSAVDFLTLCHRLKTTKRAGWVKRDVQNPESIADHMYRMGLMALISADLPGLDRDRCIKMAIVHDLAEAIVGDITPHDGVSKEEKSRREKEAINNMCSMLGDGARAKEICELWWEYEENSSPEAKVVKDFDKVEMILQALEYENEQGKDLDEFFQSTAGKFQTEVGKAWASEIRKRRKGGKEDGDEQRINRLLHALGFGAGFQEPYAWTLLRELCTLDPSSEGLNEVENNDVLVFS